MTLEQLEKARELEKKMAEIAAKLEEIKSAPIVHINTARLARESDGRLDYFQEINILNFKSDVKQAVISGLSVELEKLKAEFEKI